jgi:membrane protein involved in colicin uptake
LAEEVACYKKFAVNNCLDKVNIRRREAMAGFRQQEILLNDEERKLKGAEQIRKINEKSSPEKKQQSAERRTKALVDYQERLKREKNKQQAGTSIPSNENAASAANAERLLVHQKKNQARADMQAKATEKAKKFNERQKEAQARRIQHEADQLKRGKPAAKQLPLPE